MTNIDRRPWIVLVGGFLGSGKTTLILAAARELRKRGLKAAVVWNDQGVDLVDSQYGALSGAESGEVTGGCFCCRLSELIDAMEELRAFGPDVIFAEPVGSCTDVAATVLRPLLEYSEVYRLAPLTVLVDPARAREMTGPEADADMRYLFEKQSLEADLICLTKADVRLKFEPIVAGDVRQLSAKTGQGVAAWLDEVLSGELSVGQQGLEVDYGDYARAEAALAWLNSRAVFAPEGGMAPAMLLGPLLDELDRELSEQRLTIAHLKGIVYAESGWVKASICRNGQEPVVEGEVGASPASQLELLLNLRVVGSPEVVRGIVERAVRGVKGLIGWKMDCFSPAAPVPERRILAG